VNVVAYIGLIMLAGIVVNQSIVLIDAVNQARERGLSKHDAIVEAGRLRLRPILITKLTTILGLLPMALGLGEGAEVRAPMAITVIGGVLLTTFLTLLVIPVVYSVLDRKTYPQAGGAPAAVPAEAPATG
jgi:HAE1 family hydrophobic/amphiphilic exporter-1